MPAAPAVAFFPILANVGTPLMWATAFHLFIGNFFIGCLEGYLIARIWRVSSGRAIGFMILANYASAWIGVFAFTDIERLLTSVATMAGPFDPRVRIDNVIAYHACALAAMWLVTAMLEWPFCRLIARGRSRPWHSALGMSLLAQSASYPLLSLLAAAASSFAPGLRMTIAPAGQVAQAAPFGWVYFLGDDGHSIRRIRLDGTRQQVLGVLDPPTSQGPLHIGINESSTRYDLCGGYPPVRVLLPTAIPREAVIDGYRPIGKHPPIQSDPELGAPVADLRPERARDCAVSAAFWPHEGLSVRFRNRPDDSFYVALDTPLAHWTARWPSILPGDFVVFEFGPQIVLLDTRKRRIAFLTFGQAPLVVLDVEEPVR